MSWPWNELGLDGPASLSEIRRAYARRTREVHPEEDPEGFQRLHEAYQEARAIARRSEQADPVSPLEEPTAPLSEEGSAERDEPPSNEEDDGQESWDYDRILAEEQQKRDDQIRKALQRRTGLNDGNDDWEFVQQAIYLLQELAEKGVPLRMWQEFLESSLFARVAFDLCFLEALGDWLDTAPPLNAKSRLLLKAKLAQLSGEDAELYADLYEALGAEHRMAPTYYYSATEKQRKRLKDQQKIRIIFVVLFLLAALITVMQNFSSEAKVKRQAGELARWISQDLGMTIRVKSSPESFMAEELPGLVFQAKRSGERDPEKGENGYVTNLSTKAILQKLAAMAESREDCTLLQGMDNDLSPEAEESAFFALEFPLDQGREICLALGQLLEEAEKEPWYGASPLRLELSFEGAGVSYYRIDLREDAFDAQKVAEYCETKVPAGVCGYILNETGLVEEDCPGREVELMDIGMGDPEGEPFWQFAAVDAATKDVVRVYAFSDEQKSLVSYPPEAFREDSTLQELRKVCLPWTGKVGRNRHFPHCYRYEAAIARFESKTQSAP